MRKITLACIVTGALLPAACNGDHPTAAPTTTTTPPPPSVAAVTRIVISGKAALTAVGDSSQLTATAQRADGTTTDVTGIATWTSSDGSTIDISSTGLATVRRLGIASVTALYDTKVGFLQIKATPPGTSIVSGRAREPGRSGLSGVLVSSTVGLSMTTGEGGEYSFGGVGAQIGVTFTTNGYEPVSFTAKADAFTDMPMQPVTRVAAGDTANWTLAPHDVSYTVAGAQCYPCRMVRLTVARSGTLDLDVAWNEVHSALSVWVSGQTFTGDTPAAQRLTGSVPVPAGELQLYVGLAKESNNYVPVTFSTKLR